MRLAAIGIANRGEQIIKDVYAITAHHNDWRRWHPYDPSITRWPEAEPVPEGMDWDTWLTTAQWHDYNGKYHPGNWRGWFDCHSYRPQVLFRPV
ncbi:MAG: hypothetical protein J6X25_06855 [Bacteroidales bacterium]|nr:hypothetical protein [Bacteroidales bacterium]